MSLYESSSLANDLRLEGAFHDVVIKVDNVEFRVHKIILARCIPYFRAFFSHWVDAGQMTFSLSGLSPAMMELIIEFAYTGSVSVTAENVQELLMTADQFNVMKIVQACCKFLEEALDTENCVGIWQLTKEIWVPELQLKALRYILDHFQEVVHCDEFQCLSAQELVSIIESDELNVKEETFVYDAVVYWTAYAPEFRRAYLNSLLREVRFGLTSLDFITTTVLSNKMVTSSELSLHMLSQVSELFDRHGLRATAAGHAMARPRLPTHIVLATGGCTNRGPTDLIETYDVSADHWNTLLPKSEQPRANHGTVYLDGCVYLVGGLDRTQHLSSVCRFDLSTQTWREASPMHFRRCHVSVTTLGGFIYAMGGLDGQVRHSTAECYRPATNQWSIIPPMHERRSCASCTTLHNRIYICGGFDGYECLRSCEYFSLETRQWTMISSMTNSRSGGAVVAYADSVFALGGFDGGSHLCSVEYYKPETNSWHSVAPMLTARSNFGIAVINDRLYVFGGFDGHSPRSEVEFYSADTRSWTEVNNMSVGRSALSCCLVPRFPYMTNCVANRDELPYSQGRDEAMDSGEA